MGRHAFTDPSSGADCRLVIDETAAGEHGVEHPDCTAVAQLVLDGQWWCHDCNRLGRAPQPWAAERWHEDMRAADWAGA